MQAPANKPGKPAREGRKRLKQAIYKRDPAKPEQAPHKPEELKHDKLFSIRFTQAEWEGILRKASQAGNTPTAIVRAGALGLPMPMVVTHRWTQQERDDYRVLVNKFNTLNRQQGISSGTEQEAPAETAELCSLLRRLLSTLVPPQVG